jgi:hypothetical protein
MNISYGCVAVTERVSIVSEQLYIIETFVGGFPWVPLEA